MYERMLFITSLGRAQNFSARGLFPQGGLFYGKFKERIFSTQFRGGATFNKNLDKSYNSLKECLRPSKMVEITL